MSHPNILAKKLVIVGDGACGKTCLLAIKSTGMFPEKYTPTVFTTYTIDIVVDSINIEMQLFDTAGQEAYDRLRPLSYPNTDVVLLCYSVDSPDSLANIKEKWIPEIDHYCPQAERILVCTKIDLREDKAKNSDQVFCSEELGREFANQLGCRYFVQTSALWNIGVDFMFEQAGRACILPRNKNKGLKKCSIL